MYFYVLVYFSCLLLLVFGGLYFKEGEAGYEVEDGTCTCTGTAACSDLEVIGDGSREPYFLYLKEINFLKKEINIFQHTCVILNCFQ